MTLQISSSSFDHGSSIPAKYTADGEDISPALSWSEPPAGTASFAIICDDPDAPRGTWVHWVIYDIPAETRALPSGIEKDAQLVSGASQGMNDFGQFGYGGPSPPSGKPHRYFFRIYALDQKLNLNPGATRKAVVSAMKDHILATGEITGTYQR